MSSVHAAAEQCSKFHTTLATSLMRASALGGVLRRAHASYITVHLNIHQQKINYSPVEATLHKEVSPHTSTPSAERSKALAPRLPP